LQEISDIKDDHGLFACALTVAPRMETTAPDPSAGDGQYVVVVKGSLLYNGKEHKALTVVYVEPQEGAFRLRAGEQGLEALVLNFPTVAPQASEYKTPSPAAAPGKWQCLLCAFAYDESVGMPDDGIPAGTHWEDVPETWTCPDCGATKADFEKIEA
jgi:rubredoxin